MTKNKKRKNHIKRRTPVKPETPPVRTQNVLPITRPRFAFIQTCMGRKAHVMQSSQTLLYDSRIDGLNNHYVLVDFFCPEKTADWAEKTYGDRVQAIRVADKVTNYADKELVFNKPTALNFGAHYAITKLNANFLVFFDSDTLITSDLLSYIFSNASTDRFMIFKPDQGNKRDLTGFLVVHKRPFVKVDGYDNEFIGWGAEDLDIRLRLYFQGIAPLHDPRAALKDPSRFAMGWDELPLHLANSIPHDDSKRVEHYTEKDKDLSHTRNLDLLCSNLFNRLGKHPLQLQETPVGPAMRRLLGMDPFTNPKDL